VSQSGRIGGQHQHRRTEESTDLFHTQLGV
jgi:hypothetical protein